MHLENYRLILASNSPRRKELLSGLDVPYEIYTIPNIDEAYDKSMPTEEVAQYLAQQKASAYIAQGLSDDALVLTADTVVVLGNEILEKPHGETEAKQMLRKLSGKTHQVITGVCLTTNREQICFSAHSHVTFGNLSDEEIDYYVSAYKPMDKAGAYGVQEWIGYVAVKHIEGSYFNIMGLPIYRVYEELRKHFGLKVS